MLEFHDGRENYCHNGVSNTQVPGGREGGILEFGDLVCMCVCMCVSDVCSAAVSLKSFSHKRLGPMFTILRPQVKLFRYAEDNTDSKYQREDGGLLKSQY